MTGIREWTRDGFTVSTDPARLQLDVIHGFLARAYWSDGIPRDVVARSIEGSIDVFVLETYRSRGLARPSVSRR